ncbi:MAG: hypothetical protein AAF696_32330 [Bacteroidota bacterium]
MISSPVIIYQEGPEIHQYWEFENEQGLWKNDFKIPAAIQVFRDSLKEAIGPDSLEFMLRRERTITERGNLALDSLDNWQIVHQGYAGSIRDINYLEAQILNYQISRFPLFSHPTEFHGFIAQNPDSSLVRVYISASDTPFPPREHRVKDKIKVLVKEGWKLRFHLHNHYRDPAENYVGAMGPSMADAHYYKNLYKSLGLEKALITNGYTTCELRPEELSIFNSH